MSPQKSLAPARSGRERGPEGGPGAEVFYFDSVMDIEERMTLGLEDLLFPEGKVDSPDLMDDFILTTPTDAKRPNVFNTPTANSDQGEYDDIFEMMKPHESITDSKDESQVIEAVWSLDTSGSYSPVTDDITPVGEAFTITLPISSSTSDLPTELAPVKDYDSIFSTDPMNVVSVLDVEGKEESAANISLIIPEKEELSLIDTPSVERALEMDGNHDDLMFDLLSFVNTDAMPIDDPTFLSCLDDLSPSALNADPLEMAIKRSQLVGLGKFEITPARSGIAPEKRKKDHARKRSVASSTVTSSSLATPVSGLDHAYVFDDNSWTGPEDGTKEVKYRRMRDLNNEASKRCRENRKRKVETLEEEEHFLILSNAELREKVMRLEKKVTLVKEYVKNIVRNGRSGK